ncbi:MAG: hypothetical protein Q7R95_01795 [bacterium]|nr:hypothetical protein [bacterium]
MYKNDLKKENWFMQWFHYYIKPLPPKKYYETTYTNINEFKFDFHPRLKKLVFSKLIEDLTFLHDLQVNQGYEDKRLIIEAEKLNLLNCLIVVDEGSHYFTKPVSKVIVWWLTYHGHLYQDIHIISQHMDQMPDEYLKNGEFFYKVYPPSKAIFINKFSLGLYSCIKFYKNCKVQDLTIPFLPEVGFLYVSGKKAERKPVLKKFIPIFIFLILFFFWAVNNFFSTNDEQIDKYKQDNNISNKKTELPEQGTHKELADTGINNFKDFSDTTFFSFKCSGDMCSTDKYKKIPLSMVLFLFQNNPVIYGETKKIINQFTVYNLLLNSESVNLLDRSFSSPDTKKKNSSTDSSPVKLFKE